MLMNDREYVFIITFMTMIMNTNVNMITTRFMITFMITNVTMTMIMTDYDYAYQYDTVIQRISQLTSKYVSLLVVTFKTGR